MKHVTSINDLSKNDIISLINDARGIKTNPREYGKILAGKIIAALFFEPSTRTRLSFESAASRLGAAVIGFADAATSSAKKGETLEDTIKIVNGYADLIVLRHYETGAANRAAAVSKAPIINAGDGSGEHPTQALVDLFTIQEKRGALDNITIAFVGDLKFGRTVHSLSQALSHFNPKIYFVSPSSLRMPSEILEKLKNKKAAYEERETWEEITQKIDILYMTRVQEERFSNKLEYEKLKLSYILNKQTALLFREDCLFMHPLPRVGEIDPALDSDPRSIYFEQAHNGVWVRMALLRAMLNQSYAET